MRDVSSTAVWKGRRARYKKSRLRLSGAAMTPPVHQVPNEYQIGASQSAGNPSDWSSWFRGGAVGTSGRGVGSDRRSHHRRGCRATSRGSGRRDPAEVFEFSSVPGPQSHAPLSDGAASCSSASRAWQWGNPLQALVFLAHHLVVIPHHGSRSRSQVHLLFGRLEHRRCVQPPAAAVRRRAAEPARGTRQQRIRG